MKKGLLMVLMAALLAASLNAQSVAPNEVRVFKHPNYIGDSASYKVEDGMRHKLVSFLGPLDNDISSMLIGSEVVVMPFTEANFNNNYRTLSVIDGSMLNLGKLSGPFNDSIRSLVVFRKSDFEVYGTYKDPWGAYLGKSHCPGNYCSRFIPLPEQIKDVEVRHGLLGSEWKKAFYVIVNLYDQLEITLYDQPYFQGKSLYLPGAAPEKLPRDPKMPNYMHFPLEQYEFEGKQSSLILRVRGAVPPPPERTGGGTGTTHRAPPAGDAPKTVQMKLGTIAVDPINIAGTWKSNIGSVYEIVQNKDKFTWKVTAKSQTGEGTITGDSISATWVDPQGRGGAKGKIILDGQGKAIRIQRSNGVVFTR